MTDRSVIAIVLPMPQTKVPVKPKREEILDIASRLFYQQGYGATGIKQIIEEAGIAKGTFYSHFASKEELGLAWLRSRHELWTKWLEDAIRNVGSPAKKILATFDFLEKWLLEFDYRGCAFINTMAEVPDSDSPLRKEVENHKRALHERFQELATEHFKDGKISAKNACHTGTTIYLLFEGAVVEAQNFHEPWPIHTARKASKALLAS